MSPPDNPIAIAAAIDARYLVPLRVMLTSLIDHLPSHHRAVLYLVHTGLPASALAQLDQILETHAIHLTPAQRDGAIQSPHFPPEAAFSLLLPDLLPPPLTRILFLDADLLIRADITPLWHTPLGSSTLAATVDQAVATCGSHRGVKNCRALGIPPSASYFNGGLLLIDLDRWRRQNVSHLARQYLIETGDAVDFLHQEALNTVLWNHWLPLDQRWNCLANRPCPDARIVHFAGRIKPWRMRAAGPHGDAYHDVLARLGETERGSAHDTLLGTYDRYLRPFAFPLERWLWSRRLI